MNRIQYRYQLWNDLLWYLRDGNLPKHLSVGQLGRFKRRFSNGDYTLNKDQSNVLYKGKIVIPDVPKITDSIIRLYYEDPLTTSQNPKALYHRIILDYEGISVGMIKDFLERQRTWQMNYRARFKSEKGITPIYTSRPKEQFQIDFIDMSSSKTKNLGYQYVLTIIDHFSKYAWVYETKTRESEGVAYLLQRLFEKGHVPETLHADNEFRAIVIQNLLIKYGIKFVASEPYKPQSHGCIERFNRTLKGMIAKHQTLFNNAQYIDVLQDLVRNYNTTVHSAHKMTPLKVYKGENQEKALATSQKYRQKKILKINQVDPIPAGASVRLNKYSFPEERRKTVLEKKGYLPSWTAKIYKVKGVAKESEKTPNPLYFIEGENKLYEAHELLVVSSSTDDQVPERPEFNPKFVEIKRKEREEQQKEQEKMDQEKRTRSKRKAKKPRHDVYFM